MFQTSISVRGLVEFVYRSGDLDNRFQGKSKMNEGQKVHQKIQNSQGLDYRAEVTLQKEVLEEDILLKVSGRADGILETREGFVIDEIKGTGQIIDKITEETYPVHWAQAKVYGHIFCEEESLDEITIQLTYVEFESNEIKRLRQVHSCEALKTFFDETVNAYLPWVRFKRDWQATRNASITQVDFPFDSYRKGQRQLAVSVYNTIKEKTVLYAEAPTGIGKTISTLFPTIKAMNEGLTDKVFYLSAKVITKKVAEENLDLLAQDGLRIKRLTLTAKDKICFKEKAQCYPDKCQYAKGHFDRVNDALWDLLTTEDAFNKENIEKIAQKHKVCPYEFSLDVALFSDIIICDYNYAFDPRVYLRRFFDVPSENYVFLVDEAHNLVDRARNMFSAELHKDKIMKIKNAIKGHDKHLLKQVEGINRTLLDVRKKCDDRGIYVDKYEVEAIYQQLKRRATAIEKWLTQTNESDAPEIFETVLDFYFEILSYLRISELYDDGFIFYITGGHTPETLVKLYCINPASQLNRFVNNSVATVFFSATLSPMQYYQDLLCKRENAKELMLGSPFAPEHKCVLYTKDVSVKYRDREASIIPISHYIHQMAMAKQGNYMIFLPSYSYMKTVSDYFISVYEGDYDIMIQEREMSDLEKEAFLETFKDMSENRLLRGEKACRSLIGFGVLGGVFSEGIDLKGDLLIGTVVVGVGLPMINFENNLIKDYFDEEGLNGFAYAYQYPGINKVMQAAGRVIRSERDKGVIILLDDRLSQYYYRRLLPRDWGRNVVSLDAVTSILNNFWKEASQT